MKEPRLNELQGASRLTLGFYNRLIRRIECIASSVEGGEGGSVAGYSAITLNVCSNGTPATLVVLGKLT